MTRPSYEVDPDDEFYVENRKNICVVCGSEKDYSRFFIIPTLYRPHLPEVMKSHRSHDIVLLCFGCHDKASRSQDKLKYELVSKHGIPLNEVSGLK